MKVRARILRVLIVAGLVAVALLASRGRPVEQTLVFVAPRDFYLTHLEVEVAGPDGAQPETGFELRSAAPRLRIEHVLSLSPGPYELTIRATASPCREPVCPEEPGTWQEHMHLELAGELQTLRLTHIPPAAVRR